MRKRIVVDELTSTPPDTLKLLLRQRRETGSAAFDAALWRATIDWLSSRTHAAHRSPEHEQRKD